MKNIIIDLQNSDTWKIQLKIAINLTSLKDAEEERIMHSRSDNVKFTSYNDASEVVVNPRVDSLRSRYHRNLETSMR